MSERKYHYDAVFWDLDETLLDSREFIHGAFHHVVKKYSGRSIDEAALALVMGRSLEDCYKGVIEYHDFDELKQAHIDFQFQTRDSCLPFPYAVDVVGRVKSAGLKNAAVSNRYGGDLDYQLENSGLINLLDFIADARKVENKHRKPNPEHIFFAMRELNLTDPSRIIMLGDTENDIKAGRNAGTDTAAVTWGSHSIDRLLTAGPNYVVNSIRSVLPIVLRPA